MTKYWLGVTRHAHRLCDEKTAWWCLPEEARRDDRVLMYASRDAGAKYNGIFGLFDVERDAAANHPENQRCNPFGKSRLYYVPLRVSKIYEHPLTSAEIKNNWLLQKSTFVRCNFQSTVFSLAQRQFESLVDNLEAKESQAASRS